MTTSKFSWHIQARPSKPILLACVCIYVYMYVCMYIFIVVLFSRHHAMHPPRHTRTHTHIHIYTQIHSYKLTALRGEETKTARRWHIQDCPSEPSALFYPYTHVRTHTHTHMYSDQLSALRSDEETKQLGVDIFRIVPVNPVRCIHLLYAYTHTHTNTHIHIHVSN